MNIIKPLPPFKRWTLENFPFIEADFDAITSYELYCKVVEYLKEVASRQNELDDAMNYVLNYFNNLNVQEEIDNKLDEMVESGEFGRIIDEFFTSFRNEFNTNLANYENSMNNQFNNYKNTINAEINTQNTNINNKFDEQNALLEEYEDQIRSVVSGSPLVASSTSEMTNTGRIYVNTTDGKWYYYDGDSWEIGGTYQTTGIGTGEITINNLESALKVGLKAKDGVSGAITTTGGYYSGAVGSTVSVSTNASWRCGELEVVAGDIVAVNFVNYDTNYGGIFAIKVVDENDEVLENHTISEFIETSGGRTYPVNTILTMPTGANRLLFNERIKNTTLSTPDNPIWTPVKITSYNYCDSRLDTILTGSELMTATDTLDGIYSLLTWGLSLGAYKTKVYNVEALSKIHIKYTIPEVNYLCLALFTDANDNVIGYSKPLGSSSRQSVDLDINVPSFATKMYICYNPNVSTPEVALRTAGGVGSTSKNITASYTDGVLTLKSNLLNNEIKFKNFGGNNLFMIYSYKINGNSTTLETDMTPSPYIVEATENANGDRETEGFTGGNHQWNNTGSGSTATAEEISKLFYADNSSFITGTVNCDEFTIIETNRVQATNTCLEAGGGRNVLEEKITFKYDGRNLKVTTQITPLETIKLKRYYAMQIVGANFKYYGKKIYSSPSSLTTKPELISSSTNISMKMNNGGLGDYDYNHNTYAVEYQSKSYYSPVFGNNSNFTSSDILWLSGEYIFDNV